MLLIRPSGRARWAISLFVVAIAAIAVAQDEEPCGVGFADFASTGDRFALLVSIDRYPDESMPPLAGPGNDMARLCSVLKDERYGHSNASILRLHGEDASRESILAGLDALAERSQRDVVLTFAYGGHGSWVLDQPGALEEPDGRDETLCPWDRHTEGDIRDDEINDKLRHMLAGEAHVVVLFDACHSGSGTRGSTDDPGGLFYYRKAEDASPAGAPYEGSAADSGGLVGTLGRHERLTLLAAAADHQKAAESDVRVGFGITRRHGAFSYAVTQALDNARPGAAWDELVPVIQAGMPRGLHHQTPQFAGDLRTRVFGTTTVTDQPHFTVERVMDGGATISVEATAAAMLEEGSVLAVYRPGTEQLRGSDGLLGTWRVTDQAARRVVAARLQDEGAEVPVGSPVVLMVPGGAFQRRTVRVGSDLPAELRAPLQAALAEAPLVQLLGDDPDAVPDLGVFVHDRHDCVVVSGGLTPWPSGLDGATPSGECVAPTGDASGVAAKVDLLTARIVLLAKYERFLAIDNPNEGDFVAEELVELELVRYRSTPGSTEVVPHRPRHSETGDVVFCPDDRFTASVRAIGDRSVYTTVVYLPNNAGIYERTFDKGSQALVPSPEPVVLEGVLGVGPPCGTDYMKVFVVEATARSKAFDAGPFEQRGFPTEDAKTRGGASALSYWVQPFLQAQPATRGGSSDLETGWSTLLVPFRVVGCTEAERERLCAEP